MPSKVTPLDKVPKDSPLLQVISYELSPMFAGHERYNPDDLVTRRGLRIYRAMYNDEQVKAVTQFKRDAVTSRGYQFVWDAYTSLPDEEKVMRQRVFERALRDIRGSFEDGLNAIAKGRIYGYSLTEMIFDNIKVEGKTYVGLNKLMPRDPGTFVFYTDEFGVLEKVVQRVAAKEIEVKLDKFIHYVHAPDEDVWYGASDLRQAYRSWYMKDQTVKLYATYLERYAGGFTSLSLDQSAGITAGSPQHEALKNILRNLRNMTGIILPPGVTMDVHMPGSTAEYREALHYFDLGIAKSLLVPNLLGLSYNDGAGSLAQSQTHLEAFFWTLNADARRLEACLNEQLFRRLGDMNWGDSEYPQFKFRPSSNEHIKWLIDTWKSLVDARAVIPTEEDEKRFREILDMPAREEDSVPMMVANNDIMAENGMLPDPSQLGGPGQQGGQRPQPGQQAAGKPPLDLQSSGRDRAANQPRFSLSSALRAQGVPEQARVFTDPAEALRAAVSVQQARGGQAAVVKLKLTDEQAQRLIGDRQGRLFTQDAVRPWQIDLITEIDRNA